MKRIIQIFIACLLSSTFVYSQQTYNYDCAYATPVCDLNKTIRDTIHSGQGRGVNEIQQDNNTCWNKSESFPFWYKFTAASTGPFEMKITPYDGIFDNDWDWILFDVTEGCGPSNWTIISCNYSEDCFTTGISSSEQAAWLPNCVANNPWESTVTLDSGRTYAIILDAFELPGANFSIEFNFNNVPGHIDFMRPLVDFSASDNNVCQNDTITFSNNSIGPEDTYYIYDFGDGTVDTTYDASHSYAGTGTYQVVLSAYSESSRECPDSDTLEITVEQEVAPSFSASDNCFGEDITFTNTSTGSPASFIWDFGTGATPPAAMGAGPHSVGYNTTGSKTITLTADNGTCSREYSSEVEIFELPDVSVSASPDTICSGKQSTLSATGAVSYDWFISKEGPPAGNDQTLNVAPENNEIFYVEGTDNNGCTNTDSVEIHVNPLPAGTATLSRDPVCEGESVTITATFDAEFTPATSGAYSFDGGNNWQDSDSFFIPVVSSDTTVNVQLIDDNGCTSELITQNITVLPGLYPDFTWEDTCFSSTTRFTDNSGGNIDSYAWDFTSQASPASANTKGPHEVTFSTTGTHSITLTADNAACQPVSVTKSVNIAPLPVVTASISDDTICFNEQTVLNAAGATSYQWFEKSTGMNIGSEPSLAITASASDSFYVAGTDANGCTNYDTTGLIVNPLPTGTVSAPDTVCSSEGFDVTALMDGTFIPAPEAYSFDGGITFQNSDTYHVPSVTADTTVNVVLRDKNGCTGEVIPVDIIVIPALSPDFSVNNTCFGDSTVFTSNSSANAGSFAWDFGSGSTPATADTEGPHTISYNSTGSKSVSLTINNDKCIPRTITKSVTINPVPDVNISTASTTSCNGEEVTLNASGTENYSWYDLSNPASRIGVGSTITVNSASDRTYFVRGTDANGCTDTDTVTINIEPLPTASVSGVPPVICPGESMTVSVDIDPAFTPAPSNAYSFDGGTTFQDNNSITIPSVNSDTIVNVVVADDKGCTSKEISFNVELTDPLDPSFSWSGTCLDEETLFTSTTTGAPSSFEWDFGSGASPSSDNTEGPHNISYSSGGTKTVSLTVSKEGCSPVTHSEDVEIHNLPNVSASASVTSLCKGNDVDLSATGANSYTWSYLNGEDFSNAPDVNIVPLTDTTVIISGTDANGCTNTDSLNLIVFPIPATVEVEPDTVCRGESSTIRADLSPGYTPASSNAYSFNNGNNFQDQESYTVNNVYSDTTVWVVIRDINECISDPTPAQIFLKEIDADYSVDQEVSCYNNNDAEVSISVNSGTVPPYDYSLNGSPFQSSGTFTGLAAGSYNTIIKDAEGCSFNLPVTINQPDSLQTSIFSKTDILCSGAPDGQVTLASRGGTPDYEFNINGGDFQNSNTFRNIPEGDHILSVRDSKGCTDTALVIISAPEPLVIDTAGKTDVICNSESDGAVTFEGTGGTLDYTFSLDGTNFVPSNKFNNLPAGSYTGYIKDINGCEASIDFAVNEPAPLTGTPDITQKPDCNSPLGTITVTGISGGTGPYELNMDGGEFTTETTFTDLYPGSHLITIRDANGCTSPIETELEGSTSSLAATKKSVPVSCNGLSDGSVGLTNISGGVTPYSFSLNDTLNFQNEPLFEDLSAGVYTVYAKTGEGCLSQFSINVSEPSQLETDIVSLQDVTCFEESTGAITVKGIGGNGSYQYSFNGGAYQTSGDFGNLAAGSYTIATRDAKGCTHSHSFTIIELDEIYAEISELSGATCNTSDGSAYIDSVSGGVTPYEFTVDNSGISQTTRTLADLSSGIHNVKVTDNKGCSKDFQFTINNIGGIDIDSLNVNTVDVSCNSESTGSISLSNISGSGQPYSFNINGGTYGPDTVFNNLLAGTHIINIKDTDGCIYPVNTTITEPDAINFTPILIAGETCSGSSDAAIQITNVNGGVAPYEYRLRRNGSPLDDFESIPFLVTGLSAETYEIEVKDNSSSELCSSTKSIGIPSKPGPEVFIHTDSISCHGGSDGVLTIDSVKGGIEPYAFSIDYGDSFQSSPVFEGLNTDSVTVQVKDAVCTYSFSPYFLYNEKTEVYDTIYKDSIAVPEPNPLTGKLVKMHATTSGPDGIAAITNISGGNKPYQFATGPDNWKEVAPGADSIGISGLSKGDYSLYLKDRKGCELSYHFEIDVPFLIPNLITPNGDGKNDRFEVVSLPYKSHLQIYNRWGSRVYENDNYDNSWNARSLPDGIYYYDLILPDETVYKGWVKVIR